MEKRKRARCKEDEDGCRRDRVPTFRFTGASPLIRLISLFSLLSCPLFLRSSLPSSSASSSSLSDLRVLFSFSILFLFFALYSFRRWTKSIRFLIFAVFQNNLDSIRENTCSSDSQLMIALYFTRSTLIIILRQRFPTIITLFVEQAAATN